jgi:aspartate-semialdehyde dehydrogenase
VPVEHGHTVCISMSLETKATPDEAMRAIVDWQGAESVRCLPSAPRPPLALSELPDRPQPRRDVNAANGMRVTVGRVRTDPLLDLKLVALGHNTVRGAAGGSVLNAELLVSTGVVAGT